MTARTFTLGGSSRTGLLLAALLAVAAGLLALAALNASSGDGTSASLAGGGEAFVVVAGEQIPARTTITAGMLEIKEIPGNAMLAGAFVEQSLVVGRIARIPIYKGEQLVQEKLASERSDLGLAYIVPEGMRAMAVGVDKVIGAGGLVRPGDRVDVIGVIDINYEDITTERSVDITQAFILAQNVEVLAVEQELQNQIAAFGTTTGASDDEGDLVEQPDAQPDGTVATLALAPEAMMNVMLTEERGAIRLSVRAVGDEEIIEIEGITPISLTDEEYREFIEALLAQPK
jgi:pilus assembly protein CpaB